MNKEEKGVSAVITLTDLICSTLSKGEMANIYMSLQLDLPLVGKAWSDKIEPLLTDNGKMHDLTKQTFVQTYHDREDK